MMTKCSKILNSGIQNRRFAIKLFCSSSLLCANLPKLVANNSNNTNNAIESDIIFLTLSKAQKDLFPYILELKIDSFSYLKLILSHSKVSQTTKDSIIDGAINLNKESIKLYGKNYLNLDLLQRENVITMISKTSLGEDWIHTMLVFIVESILGDPIYNINNNEVGWTWLNHHTGLPQPSKAFL